MPHTRVFICIVIAALSCVRAEAIATPLDDYVNAPDPAYSWALIQTEPGQESTDYILTMTSQTWQPLETVSQPVWTHIVRLTIPHTVSSSIGLVRIGSGSNTSMPPAANRTELREITVATGSITAEIMYVPNQPLAFADGIDRREDDQIAYCWDKFLRSGDAIWLSRLPMTKAVVRAMDTVTAFAAEQADATVDEFVIVGASKRGWTTWTTAAVDDRVVAIAPQVIDLLNVEPSFAHHFSALGFWASAIDDYVFHGIEQWNGTPEYRRMLDIVDPYSYLHRFGTERIFIMNSAGDEFFLPDSTRFYWDDVPGPKHLRYFPNTGHGLDSSAYESLALWYQAVITDTPLPTFNWSMEPDGRILVDTSGTSPSEVILWQATNPDARDFNHSLYGNLYTSAPLAPSGPDTYEAGVPEPPEGWTAFFVEVRYPSDGGGIHRFTTEVSIVPDTYVASYPYTPRVAGDVNEDGTVDAVDVQLAINAALGVAIHWAYKADINDDGEVNAIDVQMAINAALGIEIEG